MSERDIQQGRAPAGLPPAPTRRRWLTALLVAVVFVSGLVVGSGLTFKYIDYRRQRYLAHPEQASKRFAEQISKRLDLDRDQARRVQAIIEEYWPVFQETRRNVYPAFKDMLDSLEAEVTSVLHDKQVAKWHEYIARIRQAWNPPTASSSPSDTAADPSAQPGPGAG